MANVLFSRTDSPSTKPITDGQIIFDTSGNGKMYLDNGTTRLEMGGAIDVDATLDATSTNPIQNKGVAGVMLSELEEVRGATKKGFLTDALATKTLDAKIGTTDISSIGDGTVTGAISEINGKLNINDIGITFPTELGASIISKNVMCMMNGIIYIDILFQLSNEVGNGGTVFSLMNGSSAITFNKRLDIVCYGNKMYSIVLIPNTNYFVANGFNIPAGNYKFTAIIDNN